MRWQMQWLLVLLLPLTSSYNYSNAIPVFWNSTNPMFKVDNDDHIFVVNYGDAVEIICPHYPNNSNIDPEQYEYYRIYNVDKESYDQCVTQDSSNHTKKLIMDCSRPTIANRRTVVILLLNPLPNMPNFRMNQDYYFISTSKGTQSTIRNEFHGACKTNNMKMTVQVREKHIDPPVRTDPPVTNHRTTRPTDPPTTPTTTTTTTQPTTTDKSNQGNQAHQKDNCNGIPGPCFPPDEGGNVINTNTNTGVIEVGGPASRGHTTQIPHFILFSLIFLLLQLMVCR